ncbi:3'(2'),5'-bisphosphate nucleotidase CysQ [Tindallia californiensis]|uniref:3'(2'),5'-bisphosphate nucleotidase CysQ n=1 Tax=Tindallia californiensis TaxID=159292 RepID=A0A1H3PBL7_9FIRM|nr:3'(2'),5'-bisphosphate nucleotidase CysQ [Tindallia californiensis]SDY98534.1 3'(2'),5'-bisphosphate nucleotidase [Tindallia californiensis]
MNITRELEIAKELAVKAGKCIMEIYDRSYEIEVKDDNSPLTEADQASNDVIVEGINLHFPEHAVLSEESKDDSNRHENDWCWVVDPLDGTKEFIRKNGEFTVNIALAYQHKPVLGVIYVPVQEKLFFACKGKGAYMVVNGNKKPIKVSLATEKLRMVCSRSHPDERNKKMLEEKSHLISDMKSAGSSLKGCLVASGEAEIYYRFGPTMEWDTAAMHCIAEEAGAILRQMDGSDLLYNRKDSLNAKGFYIINREENRFI